LLNEPVRSIWDYESVEQPLPSPAPQEEQQSTEALRTYFVELADPDITDRIEIIFAHTDDDAIEQALAYADEYDGVSISQLAEIDDDSNIIRHIEFEQSLAYEMEEAWDYNEPMQYSSKPQSIQPKPQVQAEPPPEPQQAPPPPQKKRRNPYRDSR